MGRCRCRVSCRLPEFVIPDFFSSYNHYFCQCLCSITFIRTISGPTSNSTGNKKCTIMTCTNRTKERLHIQIHSIRHQNPKKKCNQTKHTQSTLHVLANITTDVAKKRVNFHDAPHMQAESLRSNAQGSFPPLHIVTGQADGRLKQALNQPRFSLDWYS